MKSLFFILSIFAIVLALKMIQGDPEQSTSRHDVLQNNAKKRCPANPDALYNREQVLKKFADILNASIPEYQRIEKAKFSIRNESGIGFFIYDLSDPSNRAASFKDCVNFMDGHIYHFAPIIRNYSFSHIAVLENKKIKIFRSINCKNRGDSLTSVITYLSPKLADNNDSKAIMDRVKNYRKYGVYMNDDDSSLFCKEIEAR